MSTIVQQQFKLPGYVVSNGETTGNEWLYPNNILYVDTELALSDVSQGAASDMIIGGFNPDLSQDAVIVGIEMKLIAKMGATTIPATTLTIYAVDNTSGQDVFYPYTTPVSLTLDLATYVLGTPTYLFDQGSLSVDQINNLKLQMIANGDISVDSLLLSVFYYLPDTPTPPTPSVAGCDTYNSPIQVPKMFLQLPFLAGDTKFYLTPGSMQYADGTPVQPGDVGDCGGEIDFVFDQGQLKTSSDNNFEENVVLDLTDGSWSVLASGVVEVNISSTDNRGILPHTPYTHDDTLMSDHDAGTEVIISNSARFYNRFVRKSTPLANNAWNNILTALGSAILFTIAGDQNIIQGASMGDGSLRVFATYINTLSTITGVKWYQEIAGNYTANNINGVALYSYAAGVLTKVAESDDDGDIWKTTSGTFGSKEFNTPYEAVPGVYFIGLLYNESAHVTLPALGGPATLDSGNVTKYDFANSAKLYAFKSSQNNFPTTLTMSSDLTGLNIITWLGLY